MSEDYTFWLGEEGEPVELSGAVVIDWTEADGQIDE